MGFLTKSITPDTAGFLELVDESIHFKFNMLSRLHDNWHNGSNHFDAPGEKLLGAFYDGTLIGICGLNNDPYELQARTGRIRHLYVGSNYRKMNIGTNLLNAIIEGTGQHFDFLNTNAPRSAFSFYERIGFIRLNGINKVTHRLFLQAP
ncbi:GNAT family N-acetyltransferase [Xenorhabdus sp. 12]|uniref:GNAT family N-acetyltransferase n=1 Tax=Xenorhabdus santafensis TaxID=2582833 RepID=A0ABU4S7H2_9GAMM|nr:GNAT family N-acetyltransferase [Xenorhabdus sp. 12]MDX7986490.1 GNAT family N-acetyltransferase [Xenorhabdus sp. 12]